MPGLGRLHAGMRAAGIDRARFPTRAWLGQVRHDWSKHHNVSISLDQPNWPGYP